MEVFSHSSEGTNSTLAQVGTGRLVEWVEEARQGEAQRASRFHRSKERG